MSNQRTCKGCGAFLAMPESLETGLCFGCRAPGPEMVIDSRPRPPRGLHEVDYCPLAKPTANQFTEE